MKKKLKYKNMPENPAAAYDTTVLVGIGTGQVVVEDAPTHAQIFAELQYRTIPNDDVASTTEYRGGIRPTHAPTH